MGAYKWSRLRAAGTRGSDTCSVSCGVVRPFDSKFYIVDVDIDCGVRLFFYLETNLLCTGTGF
jgi:hypothetical protein